MKGVDAVSDQSYYERNLSERVVGDEGTDDLEGFDIVVALLTR